MSILGQNRFFSENTDAKSFSIENMAKRIDSIIEKIEKLCAVKGFDGAPLQALNKASVLRTKVNEILATSPTIQPQVPTVESNNAVTHS